MPRSPARAGGAGEHRQPPDHVHHGLGARPVGTSISHGSDERRVTPPPATVPFDLHRPGRDLHRTPRSSPPTGLNGATPPSATSARSRPPRWVPITGRPPTTVTPTTRRSPPPAPPSPWSSPRPPRPSRQQPQPASVGTLDLRHGDGERRAHPDGQRHLQPFQPERDLHRDPAFTSTDTLNGATPPSATSTSL